MYRLDKLVHRVIRYRAGTWLQLSTFFVPTPCLRLVVFINVLCVIVIVTTCALVNFHIERVCTLQQVMGPRLKLLTRDNIFRRAAIHDSPEEGSFSYKTSMGPDNGFKKWKRNFLNFPLIPQSGVPHSLDHHTGVRCLAGRGSAELGVRLVSARYQRKQARFPTG
jgi:hypothetical protein